MSSSPDWNTFEFKKIYCSDCGKDCTFDDGWCSNCAEGGAVFSEWGT